MKTEKKKIYSSKRPIHWRVIPNQIYKEILHLENFIKTLIQF